MKPQSKARSKWKVHIKAGDKVIQKRFGSIEEAKTYRDAMAAEMFGEYAYERRHS